MSLRHAILGFLEIEPASGYTLMKRFEGSVGAFWTATQSQIYRELHTLLESEYLAVELVPQDGKPARKIYSLTPLGLTELKRWLVAPLEPMQLRDPFQLRLVFASRLPSDSLKSMLADYERSLLERLEEYRQRLGDTRILGLARSERERLIWTLSVESGIGWCESQLEWLRRAKTRLARSSAAEPAKARKPRR